LADPDDAAAAFLKRPLALGRSIVMEPMTAMRDKAAVHGPELNVRCFSIRFQSIAQFDGYVAVPNGLVTMRQTTVHWTVLNEFKSQPLAGNPSLVV
jgi:hypothetical protein